RCLGRSGGRPLRTHGAAQPAGGGGRRRLLRRSCGIGRTARPRRTAVPPRPTRPRRTHAASGVGGAAPLTLRLVPERPGATVPVRGRRTASRAGDSVPVPGDRDGRALAPLPASVPRFRGRSPPW